MIIQIKTKEELDNHPDIQWDKKYSHYTTRSYWLHPTLIGNQVTSTEVVRGVHNIILYMVSVPDCRQFKVQDIFVSKIII